MGFVHCFPRRLQQAAERGKTFGAIGENAYLREDGRGRPTRQCCFEGCAQPPLRDDAARGWGTRFPARRRLRASPRTPLEVERSMLVQRGIVMYSFVCGALALAASLLLAAMFLLQDGFSSRSKPSAVEGWMARYALRHAVSQADRAMTNPIAPSAEVLDEGRDHFADHCALCHSNNGDGHTLYGDGLNPAPPNLRLAATQNKTDGELYSIIQNGVRMTGMPAFGTPGAHDASTWKLVAFIRHLPALTAAEELAMRKANPISPTELEERKQEDDFLSGGSAQPKGQPR